MRLRVFAARLRGVFLRDGSDLDREIRDHLQLLTEGFIRKGMAPEDAAWAARRQFGNSTLLQEDQREMRTFLSFENLLQDLRYAVRQLRLSPAFALVAVLSLALGIGANTAIFQLLDAVRLRPLPVPNPQELAEVRIGNRNWGCCQTNGRDPQLTYAMWQQIQEHQQAFSGIFAWGTNTFNLAPTGEARLTQNGLWVSGNFFQVLGVQPVLGRVFQEADDRRGCGAPLAVISQDFWQREFGGSPSVIGTKMTLDGHPAEIVGVTPASFYGVEVGRSFDVAVPICAEPLINGEQTMNAYWGWWLSAMGRLKPGWTMEQAGAQLNTISPSLMQAALPPDFRGDSIPKFLAFRLSAFPGQIGVSPLRAKYMDPLWILLTISGLVLLIACLNLANLMLARGSVREREISVRLALGASRSRVVTQLLSESLLLAAAGAVVGLGLARLLSGYLVAFLSTDQGRLYFDLHPDWRVLAFTAGVAALTCALFGLTPALRATRTTPAAVLKSGRGLTANRERFGLGRGLVILQIALSLVLVVGAMLFVTSFRNLFTLDTGFQQDGVLITNVDFTALHTRAERRLPLLHDLLERVQSIPGVASACTSAVVPVSGNAWRDAIYLGTAADTSRVQASFNRVSAGFFKTLRIGLLNGRDFNSGDTASSPNVAIVNAAFARRFLHGANPVGTAFHMTDTPGSAGVVYRIVGQVNDTIYRELREEQNAIVYLAETQDRHPGEEAAFLIRSNAPLVQLVPSVKRSLAEANPAIEYEFKVFKTQIRESLIRERLMATLSGFFGALAALLATIGLYGVISYMVARRFNEIGVRIALGAQRRNILNLILGEAGTMLSIGLGVGVVLALLVTRLASSMLYGVKANDPVTLGTSAVGLVLVALTASYLPARRASRLDPMAALREE